MAAVPILLFAATLAYRSIAAERASLEEKQWRASRDSLAVVDTTLGRELAALEALAAFVAEEGGAPAAIRSGPADHLRGQHGWRGIALIEADASEVVAGVGDLGRAPGILAELTTIRQPTAAILPRDVADSLPPLVLAAPVPGSGEKGRVLVASLDSAVLSDLLERSAVPEGWTVAAIDGQFRIAGRNRNREIYVGTPITPSLRAEIERAQAGYFFSLNKEGDRVYTLFTRSPATGWTVAIGAPAAVVEQPLFLLRLSLLGAGGSTVLIAGLLAFFLVRNHERRQAAEVQLAALTAEAATERRLSEIAANLPGVIYRRVLHPDGTVSYPFVSGGVERLFHDSAEDLRRPRPLAELGDVVRYQQSADVGREMLRSAETLTPYEVEGTVLTKDGEVRWIRSMALPHRGEDGSVVWDGVILDITAEKEADEQKRVLMAELDHRVRNTLALVQALASATLPQGPERETYFGRLKALAHAHTLLAETRWKGASLARIVATELAPYGGRATGPPRTVIAGPDVMLRPEAAQALVLVLHELVTNAAKHGALSAPQGRVELSWTTEPGPKGSWLTLVWIESGGPKVEPPTRQGFGRMLIVHSIRHSLGGETTLDFRPEGLRCAIRLPLGCTAET
ncbi:HWE histidine kinase domain-containing protein [Benzoatithermus flavus]|uniref:histidine kinase n=1 Tax=Benzoatithermus flavus TaxID=3108223 RepID=A0ABU8XPB1_9PROT